MSNLNGNQFKNVYDLSASRAIKQKTGQSVAVRKSAPESAELIKHENEAMAMGNPTPEKKSMVGKALDKLGHSLGLYPNE